MRSHAKASTVASTQRRHLVGLLAAAIATLALGVGTASAEAPTVSLDPPSNVSYTSAKVSGEVDPKDVGTWWSFETSTDGGATWSGFGYQGYIEPSEGKKAVSYDLAFLPPASEHKVRLVASNFTDSEVFSTVESFETLPVGAPTISIDPPTQVTGFSAHFSGTIDPEAPNTDPAFDVSWRFACTPACPGLSGTIAADSDPHTVAADATALKPGTEYEVTLTASNAAGPVSAGPVSFATEATPPQILSQSAAPLATEATLQARLNPGGLETTYRFEYGPTASYGQSTTTKTIPAGGDPVSAEGQLTGLTPAADYHYRLVATNSLGTSEGADRQFTTFATAPSIDSCPNAPIRADQGSAYLPDCRAYEMVSPSDKNGGDVLAREEDFGGLWNASADGSAIAYVSTAGFAGIQAVGQVNDYLARRGSSGWTTESLYPSRPQAAIRESATRISGYSQDLSEAVLMTLAPSLLPDAARETANLYLRDNLTGSFTTLTTGFPTSPNPFPALKFVGFSDDGEHVVFENSNDLVPSALADGSPNLYDWHEGGLALAGILPDEECAELTLPPGCAPPGGARAGAGEQPGVPETGRRGAVSADGSRIFFTALGGQLYLREDGSSTVRVSASQRTDCTGDPSCGGDGEPDPLPDPAGPQPATFEAATEDGSKVFFTSGERLTDDSTATPGAPDLYRYEAESGLLTDLTVHKADPSDPADSDGAWVDRVIGLSEDGSRVYFAAFKKLTPEAARETPNVYLWDHGTVRFVATTLVTARRETDVNVSANGRYLALLSGTPLTDSATKGVQAYLYDAETGDISCASCGSSEAALTGDVTLPATFTLATYAEQQTHVDFLSLLDGHPQVYFTSPDPLVPADVNNRRDAYRYDLEGDSLSLISSGQSSSHSRFATASPDGRNVYFTTSEQLVGADSDGSIDLYVARVGGGFPEPPGEPPSCRGDACQPSVPGPPEGLVPGTASFVGSASQSNRRAGGRARKKGCKAASRERRRKSCAKQRQSGNRKGGRR